MLDAVLLLGFGGPDRPEDIMPFLKRVTAGRGVPEARLLEVARHYDLVGGRSPYNDQASELAGRLEAHLAERGATIPVRAGMRYAPPYLADVLALLSDQGAREIAAVILAPHRSAASHPRYVEAVDSALAERRLDHLRIRWTEPFFDEPGFLEAAAQRVEEGSACRRGSWPGHVPILFTAHSLPEAMQGLEIYRQDVEASCRGVAGILKPGRWNLAWQSASGDGRQPWLRPDILDVLRQEAARGTAEVVAFAIGFLSDHVEVLYDLDVEASGLAASLGLVMRRAPCVAAHPEFVAALGRRVLSLAG